MEKKSGPEKKSPSASLTPVREALLRHQSFLITGHVNPEGDALGSAIALALGLRTLGKQAYVLYREKTPLPRSLRVLPCEGVLTDHPRGKAEVLISVDCGDFERLGLARSLRKKVGLFINIDHHLTNPLFGDINWVLPEASATGEMIYTLLRAMKIPVSQPMATALYMALFSETGAFRYQNTTPKLLRICADLIELGVDAEAVSRSLFETHIGKLNLLANTLSKIKMEAGGKIAWVKVDRAQMQKTQTVEADTEDLIDYLRVIEGVAVAVLFRQVDPVEYKVSFRSASGIDVSAMAKALGGGGHCYAAGCTLVGPWEKTRKQVFQAICEGLPC